MIEREIHQVVVPPGTSTELLEKIRDKIEPQQSPLSRLLTIRLVLGRVLHPFMHTWVTWNQYDEPSDRLLVMGLTCMFCPAGKTDGGGP